MNAVKTGNKVAWKTPRQVVMGTVEEVTGTRAIVRVTGWDRRGQWKVGDRVSTVVSGLQIMS